jgi:hypothetical protein
VGPLNESYLLAGITLGDVDAVEKQLNLGVSVDQMLPVNGSQSLRTLEAPPLWHAVDCEQIGVIECLLRRGADHSLILESRSLLNFACLKDNAAVIRALVQGGVNIAQQDALPGQGMSALMNALLTGYNNAAIELIKLGSDVNEFVLPGLIGPLFRVALAPYNRDDVGVEMIKAGVLLETLQLEQPIQNMI